MSGIEDFKKAVEEAGNDFPWGVQGWRVIDSVAGDKHRWYSRDLAVFEAEDGSDSKYGALYNNPATEMQEDMEPLPEVVEVIQKLIPTWVVRDV